VIIKEITKNTLFQIADVGAKIYIRPANDDIKLLNSEVDKKSYNKFATYMMDDYKDFIQMHYLAGRNDTPFWKFVSSELKISDRNKELIEISNRRVINSFDINQSHGTPGYPLWVHILDNAGLYKKDIVEGELNHYKKYNEAMDWMITMKKKIKEFKTQFVSNEEFFNYLKR
jgi:hypothetical protein